MTKEDLKQFMAIMRAFELNSGDTLDKERLMFYFNQLKGYDINEFELAAKKVLGDWEYPRIPPIGVFAKAMGKSVAKIDDTARNQAMLVLEKIRTVGSYGDPQFEDPVTRDLVARRFGWGTLCSTMKADKENWFEKEFIEAYKSFDTEKGQLQIDAPEELKKITGNMLGDA